MSKINSIRSTARNYNFLIDEEDDFMEEIEQYDRRIDGKKKTKKIKKNIERYSELSEDDSFLD